MIGDRLRTFAKRGMRSGMALLVVLVLTVLVALAGYEYTFYMQSQYRASQMHAEQLQARLAVRSGFELAASVLELSPADRELLGGLTDNPGYFQDVVIEADTSNAQTTGAAAQSLGRWRCSLVSPSGQLPLNSEKANGMPAEQRPQTISRGQTAALANNPLSSDRRPIRFGLVNESAKLHLPSLIARDRERPGVAREALLNLPGASPTVVDEWLKVLNRSLSISNNGTQNRNSPQSANSNFSIRQQILDSANDSRTASSPRNLHDRFHLMWQGIDLNRNFQIDPLEFQILQLTAAPENVGLNGGLQRGGPLGPTAASSSSSSRNSALGSLANSGGIAGNPSSIAATGLSDSASQELPMGWRHFLTWHSGYRNRSQLGQPRVWLNQDDLQQLQRELLAIWPSDWANFVIAYRQFGPASRAPAAEEAVGNSLTSTATDWSPNFGQPAQYQIEGLFDLVNAVVETSTPSSSSGSASGSSESEAERRQMIASPFSIVRGDAARALSSLLDEATIESAPAVYGRIDISEASIPVLTALPGIDSEVAQQIVQSRGQGMQSGGTRQSASGLGSNLATNSGATLLARLIVDRILSIDTVRQLEPWICWRSDVYSVQVVGFRDDHSPVQRYTGRIDATIVPAKISQLQPWHAWGRGFTVFPAQDLPASQ